MWYTLMLLVTQGGGVKHVTFPVWLLVFFSGLLQERFNFNWKRWQGSIPKETEVDGSEIRRSTKNMV